MKPKCCETGYSRILNFSQIHIFFRIHGKSERTVKLKFNLNRRKQEELAQQRAQMEALARLQEEQRAQLRCEDAEPIMREKLAKLPLWAKVKERSLAAEDQKWSLTHQMIQKMEAAKVKWLISVQGRIQDPPPPYHPIC